MQKITTYLWFDRNAEEAMNFYVDVFNGAPNKKAESKVGEITRHPEGSEGPTKGFDGLVLNGFFELAGQRFCSIDGGPAFKFNEAISLSVDCDDQAEIDYFWEKLSAVPEAEACGWLKDKFGLSWQIVPAKLVDIMNEPDPEKAARITKAVLGMKKLIIKDIEDARNG